MKHKLCGVIGSYVKKLSTKNNPGGEFYLPDLKFIKEMLVGIINTGSAKIAKIAESLSKENEKYKKVEKRLSYHLIKRNFYKIVMNCLFLLNKRYYRDAWIRYFVVDSSDISGKQFKNSEFNEMVYDGSEKRKGKRIKPGYHLLNCIGVGLNRIYPLFGELFSYESGDYNSENEALINLFSKLHVLNSKIPIVSDRGTDRIKLYKPLIELKHPFIIRLCKDKRYLEYNGENLYPETLSKRVELKETFIGYNVRKNGKIYRCEYKVGLKKVKFTKATGVKVPKGFNLYVLICKRRKNAFSYFLGFLPDSIPFNKVSSYMFEAYNSRWKIEEFHRWIKTEFKIEKMSLRRYIRLKNMYSLIMLTSFFSFVYGYKLLFRLIIRKLPKKQRIRLKKFIQKKYFIYYRIIKELRKIMKLIKFKRLIRYKIKIKSQQLLLFEEINHNKWSFDLV